MTYTLYHVTTAHKLIIASDSWPLAHVKAILVLRDATKQLFELEFPLKMLNFWLTKHINNKYFCGSLPQKKPNNFLTPKASKTAKFGKFGVKRAKLATLLLGDRINWLSMPFTHCSIVQCPTGCSFDLVAQLIDKRERDCFTTHAKAVHVSPKRVKSTVVRQLAVADELTKLGE